MVYGICRAMLRDAHEAEDATQQAFLSAHRALLGGARVRDEGGWLATIARNECRARIATGMRRPLSLGDEDLERIADPADEVQRREHAEALRIALADLPERQREAVVLRDLYGLRYGEVATALGLSRAATETLLFRARRAMRQRLRPVVTTALVVPLAVQEGLAQALPGIRRRIVGADRGRSRRRRTARHSLRRPGGSEVRNCGRGRGDRGCREHGGVGAGRPRPGPAGPPAGVFTRLDVARGGGLERLGASPVGRTPGAERKRRRRGRELEPRERERRR